MIPIMILTLLLTGCQQMAGDSSDVRQERAVNESVELSLSLACEGGLVGEDNTLDLYQYKRRVSMDVFCREDEVVCPAKWGVNGDSVYRYQQFFSFEKGGRTVVLVDNINGESPNMYSKEDCYKLDEYLGFGPVLGTDHFVALEKIRENGEISYVFVELDDELEIVKQYKAAMSEPDKEYIVIDLLIDRAENIHIVTQELIAQEHGYMADMSTEKYMVVSKQGEVLAALSGYDIMIQDLVEIYDDQVAYRGFSTSEGGEGGGEVAEGIEISIGVLDTQTGINRTLGSHIVEYEVSAQGNYNIITMQDANHMIYADAKGLYQKNVNTQEVSKLYQWMNHGMGITNISEITAVDGGISVVISDQSNYSYLYLQPVSEKQEIQSIGFVCSPHAERKYRNLVTLFHKRYPAVHIDLITDMDETLLRTKIMTGEGPVLVDSSLVGFENLKKLWMPLDVYQGQIFGEDELIEPAVECGRIDGTLYGMVDSFIIYTVITGDTEIKSWDYEEFIEYILKHPEIESIANNENLESAAQEFVFRFFIHGAEDNYFVDTESNRLIFREEKFLRFLDTIDKYYPCRQSNPWGSSLVEGKTLCNYVSITRPTDLTAHRILFGDDVNYIGYPRRIGSGSYVYGGAPVCIRNNATAVEKRIALDFMKVLCSHEGQCLMMGDSNFNFSIYKDLCKMQFEQIREDDFVYIPGEGSLEIGKKADNEKDWDIFQQLTEKATAYRVLPRELTDIINDEFGKYFSGGIGRKELIKGLDKRVNLYMHEK